MTDYGLHGAVLCQVYIAHHSKRARFRLSRKAFFTALAAVFLLVVAVCNIFYMVTDIHISNWDEARHGVSALEMIASGNFVVNTYMGAPDYWNLKPVLSFMPMIAGFELFGPGLLGLRFFSCVATLLTLGLLVHMGARHGNLYVGLLAAAILITSRLFIAQHNARAGDSDALFIVLFIASACLLLERSPSLAHYCLACFLAALAFLTKSFHAGPLCAAIAVFYCMDHKVTLRNALKGCGALFCFLAPVFVWACVRYQHDGTIFFEHMLGSDAVARLSTAIEGHEGSASYTIRFLVADFRIWIWVVLIGTLAAFLPYGVLQKVPFTERTFLLKLGILIAFPLALYTISPTKLPWYAYCFYPLVALLFALVLEYAFRRRQTNRPLVCLLVLAVAVGFILSEERTVSRAFAKEKQHDPVQAALWECAGMPGPVAFFLEEGEWEQAHVLVSMFVPNTKLKSGNRDAYAHFEGEKVLIAKKGTR